MKTLYLQCEMGAAGDMLMAALAELLPEPQAFFEKMNALSLPGVKVTPEPMEKCGITGLHVSVTVHGHEEDDHPHHRSLLDITQLINTLPLPETVKADALAVYNRIAQAEGQAHSCEVQQVHFHEVGALDAVADIVGVCLLMHTLAPGQVVVSPVHVGCGQVHCAHGLLPVPTPATAALLRDVPIYGGSIRGELCTPTGAALLTHFAHRFGDMPPMRLEKTGYGMGKKNFPAANCLRAFWGEAEDGVNTICELSCNLDDMTPEAVGFAMDRLLEAGCLDVFTTPIGMKKCRPGILLTCLCRPEDEDALTTLLFHHTTSLGVRKHICHRAVLSRRVENRETPLGPIRFKTAQGFGITREKPEYDDLSRLASEHGLSLAEAARLAGREYP